MELRKVYLGLGGNIGDTKAVLADALRRIQSIHGVYNLKYSRFYLTSPVSPIPQNDYINACCSFETSLPSKVLFSSLEQIECQLGKSPKSKESPRVIDIDLLLYGKETSSESDLQIPHPKLMERLFVLQPLSDLTEEITIPSQEFFSGQKSINLNEYLQIFLNTNHEVVKVVE